MQMDDGEDGTALEYEAISTIGLKTGVKLLDKITRNLYHGYTSSFSCVTAGMI
jgi:hypothetical protein